MTAAMICSHSW